MDYSKGYPSKPPYLDLGTVNPASSALSASLIGFETNTKKLGDAFNQATQTTAQQLGQDFSALDSILQSSFNNVSNALQQLAQSASQQNKGGGGFLNFLLPILKIFF